MINGKKFPSYYYSDEEIAQHKIELDPKTTALLIVDMQNEFVQKDSGEALHYKQIGLWEKWKPFHDRLDDIVIPNTVRLIDFFRKSNLEVSHARIACLHQDGRDRCMVQKKPGFNQMLLPHDSYGAQIIDELKPLFDEIIVNKTTDSAVSGTNLTRLYRQMGIKTVVVTGIVTDQCVAGTVRGLADENFEVIVVEDCCAAAVEEAHVNELKAINIIYCYIMSTDDTIKLISERL